MFFYRRQYAQVTLDSSGVVITDVALNHLHEFLFAGETLAVIAFPFQNAPESFHRSIVNAVSHTGHTLSHSSLYEFVVEGSACVLETSIAVEQRVGIWIRLNSFVKGFVNEWIIIALTDHRFTDMEYGLITDAAEETGLTLSEYIRKMVLEGKIAIRYEVVADIPELQKLTAEFGKIGSNLNQIARYFHTGGIRSKTMQDEIQSCISELWNLRKDVTRMAGDFHGSVETYRK